MAPKRKAQHNPSQQLCKRRSPREPSTRPYVYETLLPDEIRILVLSPGQEDDPLRATLETVSVQDDPKYKAISYCWGDPVFPHVLQLPQGQLYITESLYGALKRFRSETVPMRLWADAVCIDQNTLQEKNHQVAIMDQIYEKAEIVLVWLGEAEEDDCVALYTLASLADLPVSRVGRHIDKTLLPALFMYGLDVNTPRELKCKQCASMFASTAERRSKSMLSFWRKPWFSRLWTIQEYFLAGAGTFVFGQHYVTVEQIDAAANAWTEVENVVTKSEEILELKMDAHEKRWAWISDKLKPTSRTGFPLGDLLDFMMETRDSICSLVHDRIFAIRTLIDIQDMEMFMPDYGLPISVLWERLAASVLVSPSLWDKRDSGDTTESPFVVLALAGVQKRFAAKYTPSWVPDFAALTEECRIKYVNHKQTSCELSAGGEDQTHITVKDAPATLWIRGIFLGPIDSLCLGSQFRPPIYDSAVHELRENYWSEIQRKIFPWYLRCLEFCTNHMKDSGLDEESMGLLLMQQSHHTRLEGSPSYDEFAVAFESWSRDPTSLKTHERVDQEKMFYNLEYHLEWRNLPAENLDRTRILASMLNGYVGWVPEASEPGDLVTLFQGSPFPFILRKRGDGYYSVIGDAFIPGTMHGELWPADEEGVDWIGMK